MPAAQQALPRPGGPKTARWRRCTEGCAAPVSAGRCPHILPPVPGKCFKRGTAARSACRSRHVPTKPRPRRSFYESYTSFRPFAPGRALLIFPALGAQKNRAPPCPNETTKKKPAVSCMAAPAERWNIARRKASERHCEHPNAPLRAALPYESSGGRQRPNCFGRIGFICSMQPWPWQRITYTSFVVYIIRPFSGDCQSVLPAYVPPKPHARTKLFPRGLLCIASGAKARYNRGTLHSRSGVLGPCAPLRPVFRQVRVPQFQRKDLLS